MGGTRGVPAWLAHAVRWQRGPVPWGAVLRGALGAGVLLAAGAALGQPTAGVLAALGAMLAGVNDRPGSRRSALPRLALPALAGAFGMLVGSPLAGTPLTALAVAVLALPVGALSVAGPVASAASTQLLITTLISAGMPLPEPAWQRAALYFGGACWLLALRLLPAPAAFDGGRDAVAGAYDAVADLLLAAGGPEAVSSRTRLTAALDRAQDALGPGGPSELRTRFAAVLPLAEAATALTWEGMRVGERAARGPRRLAAAVRTGGRPGPLPAPVRDNPALRALDDALLKAAEAFAAPRGASRGPAPHPRRAALGAAARRVRGPAGREYGMRVAVSTGASAAVAQALHPHHWYWLPVTAVFLVKPDLGPLASRVINRALGTVAGALLFAAAAAAATEAGVRPAGVWPYALATVGAALLPFATRHFAAQTGVVTVLVLAFVTVAGDAGAYLDRVTDTLLACAIVLLTGHLPLPVRGGGQVAARLADSATATERYVDHVLTRPGDADTRFALRRAAYRTLAGARSAAELAAAELPPLARHAAGAAREVAALESLVDTATATAVRLDHPDRVAGPGVPDPAAAARAALARAAARTRSRAGTRGGRPAA
jgi:uncharacterized membrane protein YccC